MNRLSKLFILTALISMTFGTVLFAEFDDTDRPGRNRGRGFHHRGISFDHLIGLREELDLSNTQYKKLKALAEKYAELRYNNRGNHDKMIELRDQEKNEFDAILTAEQKTIMEENFKRRPRCIRYQQAESN